MDNQNQWQDELARIKSIIMQTELIPATKWGGEVYTYNGKNVLSAGGFKNHFTIWFYKGVFLEDKYNVLVTASEGKTKSLRQWRFTSAKEINEKKILEYIKEAIAIEQQGLQIKPAKFKTIPAPAILTKELDRDITLKSAFEKLTPGKQNEYIIYLNEPKQEATKSRRLEKIIPMILRGAGLNDKYK
jgi:uncharacterized protein YdeI (YjbR/CyaY-like superfamily)